MELQSIHKILYVQYRPFGDVLCNTGVLPFLRNRFPKAKLDYLVQHPYQQILRNNANIDEVLIFNEERGLADFWNRLKLYADIYRRKYDLVIDQMCGTGSAQIAIFSGARYRLGYRESRRRWAYNVHASKGSVRYSAATKFDLLQPLGIQEQPYQMEYYIDPESVASVERWLQSEGLQDEPLICVAPGSKAASKTWNPESFAKICDFLLTETEYRIVLLWADYEWESVQAVVKYMTHQPIIAPRTNLNEAAALLGKIDLLICNDTALNHLSAVTQTASLAFFGRTRPTDWSPTTDPYHYYLYRPDRYQQGDNSFGISVQEAIAKVKEILAILNREGPRRTAKNSYK